MSRGEKRFEHKLLTELASRYSYILVLYVEVEDSPQSQYHQVALEVEIYCSVHLNNRPFYNHQE